MTPQEKFDEALAAVRTFVPGFKVIKKSESKLHRAIGWFLKHLGNPSYMTRFWTTVGKTTAGPQDFDSGPDDNSWAVLLHEGVHGLQAKRWTSPGFALAYLLPQVSAPLLVLAGVALGFSWKSLLGLLALLPLPAPGRARAELEAYKVTLAVYYWAGWFVSPSSMKLLIDEALVPAFTTGTYFWMWPFRSRVRTWFLDFAEELRQDRVELTPYLATCKALASKFRD